MIDTAPLYVVTASGLQTTTTRQALIANLQQQGGAWTITHDHDSQCDLLKLDSVTVARLFTDEKERRNWIVWNLGDSHK
jgi:hypothetical protein